VTRTCYYRSVCVYRWTRQISLQTLSGHHSTGRQPSFVLCTTRP